MKHSHRLLGLASLLLMVSTSFVACGGLDPRKVTRGPAYSSGGDDPTGGTENNTGGTESGAGQPNVNPFGGAFDLGGAPPVVDGPPEVVEVDPANEATDVEVGSNVSFLFSEAVSASTVTNDSVKLLLHGNEVEGDVNLDRDLIGTFEPARRLALASQYETAVSTDVTDTTGQPLKEAFSSTFITRDGAWEEDDPPLTNPEFFNYYSNAHSGVDGRGNMLVVWPQQVDEMTGATALLGRWHRQASGWQPIFQVSEPGVDIRSFDVAVTPDGDAAVVWRTYDSALSKYSVSARRYLSGAWEEAAAASGTTTFDYISEGPYVAMAGGTAVVYFYASVGTYSILYGNSASNDGAWQADPAGLEYVYTNSTFTVYATHLGMDASGNAMLVYNRRSNATGVGAMYYAKFLASNKTWEFPAAIPVATESNSYYGGVALDDNGAAMVVWVSPAAPFDLWASRYTKAKGFAPAVKLDDLDEQPNLNGYQNALVTDGTDFFVTWGQQVGSTTNAYVNRYTTSENAWSGAELVSSGDTTLYNSPLIAVDPQGNLTVAWIQRGATTQEVYFNRWLSYAGQWSTPDRVATGKGYDLVQLRAAANGIVDLLTLSNGYTEGLPGQPYLHVFQ
jgi:hypothetical protein